MKAMFATDAWHIRNVFISVHLHTRRSQAMQRPITTNERAVDASRMRHRSTGYSMSTTAARAQ